MCSVFFKPLFMVQTKNHPEKNCMQKWKKAQKHGHNILINEQNTIKYVYSKNIDWWTDGVIFDVMQQQSDVDDDDDLITPRNEIFRKTQLNGGRGNSEFKMPDWILVQAIIFLGRTMSGPGVGEKLQGGPQLLAGTH